MKLCLNVMKFYICIYYKNIFKVDINGIVGAEIVLNFIVLNNLI